MALSAIVNNPRIEAMGLKFEPIQALKPAAKVVEVDPVEGLPQSVAHQSGDTALLEGLTASLPDLDGIAPAAYRDLMTGAMVALQRGMSQSGDASLSKAMERALTLLDQERRLLAAMDVYRNLVHVG